MRRQFGKTMVQLAEHDPNVVLLIGDVFQDMELFREKFPNRFFNLGLTEQASINIVAGMVMEGLYPVYYSTTPFMLERPFEQIKIAIDEQNLPCMLVGNNGPPTHGVTHRPLDAPGLVSLFKNIVGFFPATSANAERDMLNAYMMKCPAIVCLERDGVPFL